MIYTYVINQDVNSAISPEGKDRISVNSKHNNGFVLTGSGLQLEL